jgi:basic membrane protein A
VQGVKHVTANAEVFQNMTGSTPAAWNNPTKGSELAKSQFDRGADVVYAAAGGTGIGVYQAAKDAGKLAIGVDSNQNYLHPGTMLTSMLKRVDIAAYNAFKGAEDGTWKPGILNLGLAEDGVGWALDEHNKSLISDQMKTLVAQAGKDIVAGRIVVHDYMADNSCPH